MGNQAAQLKGVTKIFQIFSHMHGPLHWMYIIPKRSVLQILACIFYDVLYTVNVVQELFKSNILCLILCILCVSYIMCFLHFMVWSLYTVSIGCCVSKLCTVDVSPVLCLHYCQPSVPCVFYIVSTLLPAQCVMCVGPVLYLHYYQRLVMSVLVLYCIHVCLHYILPVQCAIHASSVLCLHYCQRSVLCV